MKKIKVLLTVYVDSSGLIYTYSQNKKAVRFTISNKKGLKRVLDLVNGKLVSSAKVNQLIDKGYESRLGCNILNASLNICLTNHWVLLAGCNFWMRMVFLLLIVKPISIKKAYA
uniref:LAGLIDADG homing endonuclease n=1 Tax=Percursaria percursa TaxID=153906 RepID=A0A8K1MXE7_9CHLO|nr:hypothetical protein [Percursaria percursa]